MEVNETPDPYKQLRSDVSRAISERSSVVLKDVADISFSLGIIKPAMKAGNASFRVRTNKRSTIPTAAAGSGAAIIGASVALETAAVATPMIIAGTAIAGAALTGVGAVVLAGIAVHRLATRNPDYDIIIFPDIKEIHLIFKK